MFGKDSQLNFILTILLAVGLLAGNYYLNTVNFDTKKIPLIRNLNKDDIPKYPNLIQLKSYAFINNEPIPQKYTCKGENVNPPLEIYNLPGGTQSLVLIVEDLDAPLKTFDHWLVYNIHPKTTIISENSIPNGGIVGSNSYGKGNYDGPCPFSGIHRYEFNLYALDQYLDINRGVSKKELINSMNGHVLDKGVLVGTFGK